MIGTKKTFSGKKQENVNMWICENVKMWKCENMWNEKNKVKQGKRIEDWDARKRKLMK